jgi:hypothetical protein
MIRTVSLLHRITISIEPTPLILQSLKLCSVSQGIASTVELW